MYQIASNDEFSLNMSECCIFGLTEDSKLEAKDWRHNIILKLISILENRIRSSHKECNDSYIESCIHNVRNKLIEKMPFCKVLLYDLAAEESNNFKLKDIINKSEWESLIVIGRWVILGYALIKPLDIDKYMGLEMFEIFLRGHNLGELFFELIRKLYGTSNVFICNPKISALQYWIKLGAVDVIINKICPPYSLKLKDNKDALDFLKICLGWNDTCIHHLIRMDELGSKDIEIIPYINK